MTKWISNLYLQIPILLLIVSVGLSSFFYRKIQHQKNQIKQLQANITFCEQQIVESFTIQYSNWLIGSQSIANMQVEDKNEQIIEILDLIYQPTVLFYFDGNMCRSCIDNEFENLESLSIKSGTDRIIILCSGYQSKYLYHSDQFTKWRNLLYQCQRDSFAGLREVESPVYLLTDTTGQVIATCQVSKSTNLHFENFLEFLTQYFS